MKHIRNILLLITIIFAFVMQAEVYQNMLWNFNGAYYLSSRYTTTNDDMDSFLANAEDTAEKHGVHIFSTFNQRVSNYQTRLYIYGDDTVVRDSLKSTMDIEEKTYTALIGGITVIEFEDFREAKNTGNGQEIMVSYIGDDDDIIATYQDLAKEYSISQPEFWQSTETDMMFIVWGLVAILMIVLNMIEVIRRQKEVVVRASLGENAAVIALKAVVADMISYAALFVLAKLLVSQFISGAYEDHLILAVYCAGAVLSVIPYAAFVRFDVKKAFANASDKKGMFYLLNGLKVFATAMTIFTITTNLSSIQGNLLTNTTLLENHYNDYYFGVMQIEPPFEENEEESKESKFWNDLYENEYNTINPVVCIGSRISDTDNYIFVNHNARDMLQGFSDMLTEDDEKEDIVVFVPKGKNAESYKDIAKEEIDSLTQNAEELRVVYKEYSGREQFYYLNSNREEAIDGLSRATNPIVIYQANPVYTGAIASQKKDYRFKIGTIGEKKPEDWIVVEGQHEPLIDRMSFDIVQNKLKSRQRPGQTNEISLFAGLIKCGECGKSLTIRYTNAKHPQQIYSCKTYNAFGKNHCTQHRIDYDTLYSHVLRKIRECARAALMDGEAVADRLTNTCEAEQREQREAMERSLTRDEERIEVLDKMVMRLYEDMIAGRISEQNFNTMLEKTQTEQTELKTKVSEGRKRLSDEVQLANDAKQWVEAIQEYANITELDAATLNRLIKEIVVHERIDEDKTRHISIEIHFNLKPIPEVEQVTA